MSFNMDDYVDVAERIRLFYEQFPDGRLTRRDGPQILEVAGKPFVVYSAEAWRTPDDPCPAVGTAWEPFPGPTQFTRDSELMNAETAAWGRAIIAVGIGSKKVASRQEVENRRGVEIPPAAKVLTKAQLAKVLRAVKDSGVTDDEWAAYRNALGAATDGALTTEHAKVIRAWLDSLEPASDIPSDVPAVPAIEATPAGDVPWEEEPPADAGIPLDEAEAA
jgi:hypothetical protein